MKRFTKEMEMAQEKTKSLIALFEDNHHSLIADAIFFRNCTYAAKKAAKEVGLEFKYGMLVTGNNLYHCRYLYFPGKESIWVKNGNRYDSFCLSDISIVYIQREKRPKDVLYKLRVIDTIKEDVYSIDELVQKFIDLSQQREKNDVTLNSEKLHEFLAHYNEWLIKLGIIRLSIGDQLCGLQTSEFRSLQDDRFPDTKGPYLYWKPEDKVFQSNDCKSPFLTIHVPGNEVLFAATIFSLLKPLFRMCSIKADTNFVLQLLIGNQSEDNALYEDALWLLELQTHMWCDYRDWPQYDKPPDFLFRNVFHQRIVFNFTVNKGFPVLLFGYVWPDGKGDDESEKDIDENIHELTNVPGKEQLSPQELSHLNSADCLPILVPSAPLKKDYPETKCLTITMNLSKAISYLQHRDPDWPEDFDIMNQRNFSQRDKLVEIHGRINQLYMRFMAQLNGYPMEIVKKQLQSCYERALDAIGITANKISVRNEHFAVILCSLYFFQEVMPEIEQKCIGLSTYIKKFEEFIGICSISDFACFVEECLSQEQSTGSLSIIFYHDDTSIHLRYKEYWPAFEKYCERNGIKLTISAGAFRRNILAKEGLITPQYKVSSEATYPRYDYRKKVDGVEETVLNLSKDILKYVGII